ncbi:MAG: FHA domain-containing protein [Phycisphaerales bacterium]|nr:FHA domain-containing protein [Phycisphaerales bacterium]
MPRLTVIEGPDEGKSFVLPTGEPQLIGRSSEALPITDYTVSRRHSELTPDGDIWYLSDLKSQNGTLVNGVAIVNRIRLESGDEIRVGATVLLFGDPTKGIRKPSVLITDDFDLETEVEARITAPSDSYIATDITDDPQNDANAGEAAIDHLRVIYTLTSITARIMNNRELLEAVMELVFNEFKPERGVIMIPGATDEDQMVPGVVRYANEPKPEEAQTIHVSRTILNAAMIGEGVLSTNAMTDPRFAAGDSVQKYQIRSALCAPIVFGDHFFGAIYIDSSTQHHAFVREQLALLNAVGQHTGLALANADEHLKRVNSERMAAIGETVASLSHSIKNILQGLRGGADVVEIGLNKNDLAIAQNGWGILRRNLDRIASLTINMLAFGRKLQLELELSRLNKIADDCALLLEKQCQEKGVALIVDADAEMPPIMVDPNLIHQALMNLLTNALEAVSPESGVITVRVAFNESRPDPNKPGAMLRPAATIAVIDNGPGVEEEKLAWIFEPFNTTKGLKGTGLGLAVTKRIVYEHKGRIRLESTPGKGASFRIILPADLDTMLDPSATSNRHGQVMTDSLGLL